MLFFSQIVCVLRDVSAISRQVIGSFGCPQEHISRRCVPLWGLANHLIVLEPSDVVVIHVGGLVQIGNKATRGIEFSGCLRSKEFWNLSFFHNTLAFGHLLGDWYQLTVRSSEMESGKGKSDRERQRRGERRRKKIERVSCHLN
jgi:hypothetical protein